MSDAGADEHSGSKFVGKNGKPKRVDTGPPARIADRQKRVVLVPATEEEPFERARHFDDWTAGSESQYTAFGKPPCVRDVPSKKGRGCKFVSHKLCDSKSQVGFGALNRGFGKCARPHQTCAVVGSSQHLLNASWGSLIDSHDVVIRINSAPAGVANPPETLPSDVELLKPGLLRKLVDHVGVRTDVRFLNLQGSMPEFEVKDPNGRCIFLHEPHIPEACGRFCTRSPGLCNVSCRVDRHNYCSHERCNLNELKCMTSEMTEEKDWGDDFVIMDNFYSAVVDQVVPHSTAGFKAVFYAMNWCKNVSVFGFGPSCHARRGERYYPAPAGPLIWHHYDEELMLLMRAQTRGVKALVPPEARKWISRAGNVTVMLPSCVSERVRDSVTRLFQPLHPSGDVVNLHANDVPF